MRLFLISAVGVTVVLLIFFAVKAAIRAALWKEFEKTENAPASAGQSASSSRTEQALSGANTVQDQKASREAERVGVLPKSGDPSSAVDARDTARISAAVPTAV